MASTDENATDGGLRRFAIALSFPGEHRRFVKNVATYLAEDLGRERVFFDEWHQAELRGTGADLKLEKIYREQALLVIPFFSEHYEKKWCQIEWHAIRALLAERRKEDAVVPVHLDGTRIEGWESIDLGIRRGRRSARVVADEILAAFRHRYPSGLKATTSPPPIVPTIPSEYTGWLQRECADVGLLGLRVAQGQAVRLNHVYVPATTMVRRFEAATQPTERLRGRRGTPDAPPGPSPLDLPGRGYAGMIPEGAEREVPALLLNLLDEQSLYVHGAPGSGKSTFCRWVAWLLCEGKFPAAEIKAPKEFQERFPDRLRGKLPLLVRLREF